MFIFACRIRLDLSEAKMQERVNQVLKRLNLTGCSDQRIGGFFRRGVSGGERKRISIGYEIITNPSLLILDEPTSGLDSATAMRILKFLKKES